MVKVWGVFEVRVRALLLCSGELGGVSIELAIGLGKRVNLTFNVQRRLLLFF
jgi:hypothetical protein